MDDEEKLLQMRGLNNGVDDGGFTFKCVWSKKKHLVELFCS
jgi:hypothetical protein